MGDCLDAGRKMSTKGEGKEKTMHILPPLDIITVMVNNISDLISLKLIYFI